ncbi:MAG: hypothetical protein ACYTAO_17965 [Planctomycetota bacterium]|jgi:hypothetical protein
MSSNGKNERIGICLMVVATCVVVAGLWAVLATSETALAAKKENPGGNVKQQDISTQVTFDAGALTGVPEGGKESYIDGESRVDCKTGRRRTIWVKFGNNSSRTTNLILGDELEWVEGDPIPEFSANGIDLPDGSIDQVSLSIAVGQNVSGLGEEFVDNVLYCNSAPITSDSSPADYACMLTNMRVDFRDVTQGYNWRLYFGPGPRTGGTWPGGSLFSNPDPSLNEYVTVTRTNPSLTGAGRIWEVTTSPVNRELVSTVESAEVVPGFLYFKGTKPNDPLVYVGAFDVPWSCVAVSLE